MGVESNSPYRADRAKESLTHKAKVSRICYCPLLTGPSLSLRPSLACNIHCDRCEFEVRFDAKQRSAVRLTRHAQSIAQHIQRHNLQRNNATQRSTNHSNPIHFIAHPAYHKTHLHVTDCFQTATVTLALALHAVQPHTIAGRRKQILLVFCSSSGRGGGGGRRSSGRRRACVNGHCLHHACGVGLKLSRKGEGRACHKLRL